MTKKVLLYCLKVWLTGVLLGPLLLYFFWELWDDTSFSTALLIMFYALLYGLVCSLPSALFFWLGATYVCKQDRPAKTQRLVLAGGGLLLTVAPFLFIFAKNDLNGTLRVNVSYLIPILAGIFIYRLPKKN